MKKFTRKKVKELIKDTEQKFSTLIDALIYFDSSDKDDWAWDIIHAIEKLAPTTEIELLISDLEDRNYKVSPNLLYDTLWYGLANSEPVRQELINFIGKSSKVKEIVSYLTSLNETNQEKGELNIQLVIDNINSTIKSLKP